jgi:uncharacterized protein YrrD
MLHKANKLNGYTMRSLDGDIGKVKDFYFDDHHWTIRYLVADTGTWLPIRQVLISPYALTAINDEQKYIAVDLTKKQIEDSPLLSHDKPVSQQFEKDYHGYYGWPMYGVPYMWGPSSYIAHARERDREHRRQSAERKKSWDHHLRSTHDVSGHNIQAIDGEIGHVEDFIVDDETWAIRYLIVDTRNWWPGKKVLIAPQWIERVSWSESKVFVNLNRESIKQSPEYTKESLVTRDYETELHRHYKSQGYWVDELAAREKVDSTRDEK